MTLVCICTNSCSKQCGPMQQQEMQKPQQLEALFIRSSIGFISTQQDFLHRTSSFHAAILPVEAADPKTNVVHVGCTILIYSSTHAHYPHMRKNLWYMFGHFAVIVWIAIESVVQQEHNTNVLSVRLVCWLVCGNISYISQKYLLLFWNTYSYCDIVVHIYICKSL